MEANTPTREPNLPRNNVANIPRTIASQEVYPIPPPFFTISIFVQFFSLILPGELRTSLTLDVREDDTLKTGINVNMNPWDQCEHEPVKRTLGVNLASELEQ
jgi:hypothetical protein